MELVPAERNTRLDVRSAALSERMVQNHDATIIFIDADHALAIKTLPYGDLLGRLYADAKAHGPVNMLSTHAGPRATRMVVVLVKAAASTFERLTCAARAWKEITTGAPRSLLIAAPDFGTAVVAHLLEAMASAALAGSASMPSMKSAPTRRRSLERITLLGERSTLDSERIAAVDRGNHVARWLTTLPPNVLNSTTYRRALASLAREQGWTFSLLDQGKLRKLGAGAFLAVSRANAHSDAGIVRLRYRTRRRRGSVPRLALIGKGICFDTGGINLKPHKSMFQMHEDMQGSAVALGTLLALSKLECPFDVDCWLAITENEIGARAYRPQEVVRASNGVTIQVVHSDAEGRMVLADTLALASRDKPSLIIDFATLTGACVTALTDRFSGVFTNRPQWHSTLQEAGRTSGERVWPFPMDSDFDRELESSIADVLQCTVDGKGDHILAARFLNRFVPEEIPWIHVDLAASNRSGGLAHIPTEFTGFGVRFATELMLESKLLDARNSR
ncbi:MAG: M17 family metallopeptidase [Povalibacter sp.]